MPDRIYWIWHQLVFGTATARSHELLERFNHPKEIYSEGVFINTERQRSLRALEHAKRIYEVTLKKGCQVITPDHPDYPEWLQDIYAKPAVLYVKGDLSCLRSRLVLAMVGTRRMTPYGEKASESFAEALAGRDVAIVSGLAVGVDSVSHAATIRQGGKTVGVLGCGLDADYPHGSAGLKRTIVESGGAVITEYPLGTKPRRELFPRRNRIIAGMSRGVIVTEAGKKSGALITAKLALDMGRDVFSVPGSIFETGSAGTNWLIKQGMAKAVDSVEDILEEYPQFSIKSDGAHNFRQNGSNRSVAVTSPVPQNKNIQDVKAKDRLEKKVPELLSAVYRELEKTPRTADQIADAAELDIGQVISDLTELEILGYAAACPGGMFILAV